MPSPVFVINLEHHSARRAFMETQFAALGITPRWIEAAWGGDAAVRANASVASYASLSHGEIGCFESHRRAWRKVVDEQLPGAFVVEDDVIVASDFADLEFPSRCLVQADVIKIDRGGKHNISHYGSDQVPLSIGRHLVRLLGTEYSTGCYFVTRKGAARLLSASKRYFMPVDIFMFDQNSKVFWTLSVWKLEPSAAAQYRLVAPDCEGRTELGDSISANKAIGLDRPPSRIRRHHWALRFRRYWDWDFAWARARRKARGLARFAEREYVRECAIEFETDSLDHVESARVHLEISK